MKMYRSYRHFYNSCGEFSKFYLAKLLFNRTFCIFRSIKQIYWQLTY